MITERVLDMLQVEVESYIEKLLKEYTIGFMGDRMEAGGLENGDLYDEEGRQPITSSEQI